MKWPKEIVKNYRLFIAFFTLSMQKKNEFGKFFGGALSDTQYNLS